MLKLSEVFILSLFAFYSCKGQFSDKGECVKKIKEARNLAYANPSRKSALDSALHLVNECMKCDSIKTAVVDLKVRLLIGMQKYSEGIKFVDSLHESDFTYAYKKTITSKSLRALEYGSINDTANRNKVYRQMANDIEQYIKRRDINEQEFREACTDLFAIKENYLDNNQINKEVEIFKGIYPEKKEVFEFFKK